ncbi:unnamed protein product, partial [Phaeothamnion confervicola]
LQVTTLENEALPLEMLLELEATRTEISGRRLWEGSLLLCAHIAATGTSSLSGARVLELGAGVGIAGMLAARLRAAEVALTDGDACCV